MTRRWFIAIMALQSLAVVLGGLAWLFWFGVQVKGVMYHFTTNATELTDRLIREGSLVPGPGASATDIAFEYSLEAQRAFYSVTGATGLFVIPLALAAINLILIIIARVRTAKHARQSNMAHSTSSS